MNFNEIAKLYNNGQRDFGAIHCWGDLVGGNLRSINLSGATLEVVRLTESNLEGAILSRANIINSYLKGVNLARADLNGANFCSEPDNLNPLVCSNLKYANLEQANLTKANLQKVNLLESNLKNANLEGANLSHADLGGADLTGANLTNTNLFAANLCHANLTNTVLANSNIQNAILGRTIMSDGSISHSPAIELIAHRLSHLKRKAWKPITIRGDTNLTASKFAGNPWLSADEPYPLCPKCHTPLRFFLQLNLKELPEGVNGKFGDGLLQLFYCTNSETVCQFEASWNPFSNCKLTRIVQPEGKPSSLDIPRIEWEFNSTLFEEGFPPRQIVGWKEMDDYPEWSDVDLFQGIQLDDYEFKTLLDSANIDKDEIDDFRFLTNPEDIESSRRSQRGWVISEFMNTRRMRPLEGDKLAGYPRWVQDAEYPNCPICSRTMDQFVFEFDSDDNIPYLWGDAGVGYVVQCPDHRDQITFIFQC